LTAVRLPCAEDEPSPSGYSSRDVGDSPLARLADLTKSSFSDERELC